ncbi:MAG: RusA family crossover junction endodeoxyribonuclease [Clostridium sp.]|nr:RusA family crossover junction endodeoxyribonuclease [Clostridium sp.]
MIIVEGKIKGKARPRVFNGHAVTPKDTVNYENWVRLNYKEQCGKYLEGAIKAKIIAYYKIPKSYTKTKRLACKQNIILPTKKPDADNIAKIIIDSLNNIAFHDDSQIVHLTVIKRWTEEQERVEFELEEIG